MQRRDFLKYSVALGVASALPLCEAAQYLRQNAQRYRSLICSRPMPVIAFS